MRSKRTARSIERELPFVVGVMGDFSGNPTEPLRPLKDRKFVQIDRDNFNDVMARIAPELNLKVKNTLANDDSEFAVNLKFKSMDDFDPAACRRAGSGAEKPDRDSEQAPRPHDQG